MSSVVKKTVSNGKSLPSVTTPTKVVSSKGNTSKAKTNIKTDKLPEIPNSNKPITNRTIPNKSQAKPDAIVKSTEVESIVPVTVTENIEPSTTAAETVNFVEDVTASVPVVEAALPAVDLEQPVADNVLTPRVINGNGKVVLIYEQYNEEFDIVDGVTTHENIDEVYCLSFVMPNCLIHLSCHNPTDRRNLEAECKFDDLYIREEPRGVYHGLEAGQTYYVAVEQEADQLRRDQERMRGVATTMEGGAKQKEDGIVRDDGRVMESCSCIYGNPCVDEYGCKDWSNRCAVATKNGWKGF